VVACTSTIPRTHHNQVLQELTTTTTTTTNKMVAQTADNTHSVIGSENVTEICAAGKSRCCGYGVITAIAIGHCLRIVYLTPLSSCHSSTPTTTSTLLLIIIVLLINFLINLIRLLPSFIAPHHHHHHHHH
jgi:hypothetical protein